MLFTVASLAATNPGGFATVVLSSTFLIPSTDRAICLARSWLDAFATWPVSVAVSPETATSTWKASAPSLSISLALTALAVIASETSVETASALAAAFAGGAERSQVRERAAARIGTEFFFNV